MRVLIGFIVCLAMGFGFRELSKHERLTWRLDKGHPNAETVRIASKIAAAFCFVLAVLCLVGFVAWLFGLIG